MAGINRLPSLRDPGSSSSSIARGQPLYSSVGLLEPGYIRADGRVVSVAAYPSATDIIPAASNVEVDLPASSMSTGSSNAWNGYYNSNPSPGVAGKAHVYSVFHRLDVGYWYCIGWDGRNLVNGTGGVPLDTGDSSPISSAWLFNYSPERETLFGVRTGTTLLVETAPTFPHKTYGSGNLPHAPSPMYGGGAISLTSTHVAVFYLNGSGNPQFFTTPFSGLIDGVNPAWTTVTTNLPSGSVIARVRYDRVSDSWLAVTTSGAIYRTTGINLATWTLVTTLAAVEYVDSAQGEWYVWGGAGTQSMYRSTDGGVTFSAWFSYTDAAPIVAIKKYGPLYSYVNSNGGFYQNTGSSTPPAHASFTSTAITQQAVWAAMISNRLVIGGLVTGGGLIEVSVSAGPALQLPTLPSFNSYDAYVKVTS
jgi:hypothetical protein